MSEYDSMPREFGWDDEIQRDDSPFQVLPEGDYNFTVKKSVPGTAAARRSRPATRPF